MDKNSLANMYADWIVKNSNKKGTSEFNTVADAYKETLQLIRGGPSNDEKTIPSTSVSSVDDISKKTEQEVSNVEPTKVSMLGKLPKFISDANAGEVDKNLMPKLKKQETGNRHIDPTTMQLIKSSKGAEGVTQVMPATGIDPGYGVKPLQNNSEQEFTRFSTDYIKAMLKEFDGDTEKALAAYNWGPVVLKAHIKKHGDKWKEKLPSETKNYVASIMGN
jgi:hypothetical protein